MIFTKTTTTGIDMPIQRIQEYLYSSLSALWQMSNEDWNCYGRVYRNQDTIGQYVPQAYTGQQGKEYEDVLYNDKVKCTSWFGESFKETALIGGIFRADIHLIFCVNLPKIKNVAWRGDAEVHMDVTKTLGLLSDVNIISIEQGMDNVLREYNSGYKNRIKTLGLFTDIHPAHCFRINFQTTFQNTNC